MDFEENNLTPEQAEKLEPMAAIIGNFCDTLATWQFKEGGVGIATVMNTVVNICFRLAVEHQETAMYWCNVMAEHFGLEWVEAQARAVDSINGILEPRYELPS